MTTKTMVTTAKTMTMTNTISTSMTKPIATTPNVMAMVMTIMTAVDRKVHHESKLVDSDEQ